MRAAVRFVFRVVAAVCAAFIVFTYLLIAAFLGLVASIWMD